MIPLDEWRDILWSYVDEIFEPNKPFYFSIESHVLTDLAKRRNTDIESATDCVNQLALACRTLLDYHSPKSELDPSVFLSQHSRPTYVICYIAQQILAVEFMASSENASANNFYLRYREVMGLEDAEGIPLRYVQFEKLWEVFGKELIRIKRAAPSQITFKQGDSRIDKYRHYPLSQSLLDKKSLNEIHLRVNGIHQLSEQKLLRRVLRSSVFSSLTPRSKSKLKTDYLQKEIIKQIYSFEDLFFGGWPN